MAGKDIIMMALAFFAGLVLVTIVFGPSPPEAKENEPPPSPPAAVPVSVPTGQMVGVGDGYFVYHSPEDRFFLCRVREGKLRVVDVYKLTRSEQTYHSGVPEESSHGWSFDSLSREKEAVLEAKSKHFDKVAGEKVVSRQDWAKAQELAQEVAAAGGIEFLKSWLDPKREWAGRRAAALALAERGYVETVPTLADLLREGPQVRESAAKLLVKLTGEDFLKGAPGASEESAIEKYKEWYFEHKRKRH